MGISEKNKKIIEDLYKAFVYGYPMVVLELQKRALTNTKFVTSKKAPVNQFIHAKGTASAKDKYIVMLNMDTVYSQIYFDLSKEPLYFHKPKTDRYTTVLLLDAYGDCIDVLGTGGKGGDEENNFVLVGPNYKGEVPKEFTRIDIPTGLSWALIRILVNDENDINNVKKIQREFEARPLSAYGKEYEYPLGEYKEENEYVTFEKINNLEIEEFFEIFNRLIGDNLGTDPDQGLLERVKLYGVGDREKFNLNNFDKEVREVLENFNKRLLEDFDKSKQTFGELRDGWILPKDTIAAFGREYLYRANVAWGGIGANPVYVSLYPSAVTDNEGDPLHSDNDYVFHFESLPPVDGFWSLAVYGDDKFQIPNEIDRYGINDRSEIDFNEDGSFDIYVQRSKPNDGRINNWIPSGERGIMAVLRLYLPKKEAIDGSWKLPSIIKR